MDKLKMHSPDLSQDNIAKIRALFPDCVTEATDDHGTVRLAVDFDQLRQTLSDNIVEGPQERYRLDWPGKREALLTANAPIAKTLRPTREESVNFDTTRNLFIEGDNLDALKLIQESYLGKVKLIYIDPPYNTGSDFIYRDDYSQSTPEFLVRSNQADEAGGRLVANSESNGRFHSDWLSMMYARLKLARNLLSTDGAIFVSIDDNERDNLKKIMDEIFGEDNFIVPIIWQKRITPENRRAFSFEHDYILCYARSAQEFVETRQLLPLTDEARARYKNPDSDSRGDWQSVPAIAQAGHATKSQFYKLETPDGRMLDPPEGCCWRYTKDRMQKEIQDNRIWFGSDGKGVPRIKRFLDETNQGITPGTIWFAKDVRANEHAKKDLSSIFDGKVIFDSPKPTQLIERIIEIATTGSESDIIVDFFAGSGTAAHAVLGVNARDGGRRKFISIQLPEATVEDSPSHQAGFNTIAEISKERIRRAGQKIIGGAIHDAWNRDVGFRVLKIDSSNMTDVYYRADEVNQDELFGQVDSIKPDRAAEDLLFQVLLDWGVELTLSINRESLHGKTVYSVDGNTLIACFETGVTDDLVKDIAGRAPLRAVFRDTSFARDADRINAEQLFRQLSPGTELKAI